jgi:hypothetical protein
VNPDQRVVGGDIDALHSRTNVASLLEVFAGQEVLSELLAETAVELRSSEVVVPQESVRALWEVIRARLSPSAQDALFLRLRARYDEILDARLLGDRTVRPTVPYTPMVHAPESRSVSASAEPQDEYAEELAYVQHLIRGASYSVRMAASEGNDGHYLRRALGQLADAASWLGMLRAEPASAKEPAHASAQEEFSRARSQLASLIERRLGRGAAA